MLLQGFKIIHTRKSQSIRKTSGDINVKLIIHYWEITLRTYIYWKRYRKGRYAYMHIGNCMGGLEGDGGVSQT